MHDNEIIVFIICATRLRGQKLGLSGIFFNLIKKNGGI